MRLAFAATVTPCLAMIPNPREVPRFLESPAAQSLLEPLKASNADAAAQALEYPPGYSSDQLVEDRRSVAEAAKYLFGQFGRVTKAKPFQQQVAFLEVGISGGPEPFWWQAGSRPETRQYIYEVEFEKLGPGFLKILTHTTPSREVATGFAFGLGVNAPEAEARIRAAMGGLMDLMGLPKEHPARSMPLPRWDAPAL
jgi:hypothetical protein